MKDDRLTILEGDCRETLKTLPDNSIDSCVTDPPYELGFMGKAWDQSGVAYDVGMWREVLRVLKPGGHLLSFGGTRTYHRMACAIEDAGFEIRDQIAWVYGSGFPKSLDVAKAIDAHVKFGGSSQKQQRKRDMGDAYRPHPKAGTEGFGDGNLRKGADGDTMGSQLPVTTDAAKQWDGWGTALKPAWEPICVARKPLIGTVAENVQQHGTGALNIDGCRIETEESLNGGAYAESGGRKVSNSLHGDSGMNVAGKTVGTEFVQPSGRWPANLIHDGSDEVVALFPDRKTTWVSPSHANNRSGEFLGELKHPGQQGFNDSGSAARFFYCAKVSPSERGDSKHPTMKPVDLMRYLCRLVTPRGGTVLDPFGGSGSTAVAAAQEAMKIVLCELNPEYIKLIHQRCEWHLNDLFSMQEFNLLEP